MAALITPAALEALTTVAQVRDWTGLPVASWTAVDSVLGGANHLRILAFLPSTTWQQVVQAARVPVPAQGEPGDDGHVPATERELTAVERTQVGLMAQLSQMKLGRNPVDPFSEPLLHAAGGGAPAPAGATGGANAGHPVRKVKNNQVLDQADEGEVPELTQVTIDEHFKILQRVKGGPVRPEAEPSPDQISAMRVRVLELGLAPYADFGIFVNYQGRFSRTLKFLNHVLQPDGTFRAVEVAGPPNYDSWLSSWRVYENTLLMLEHTVAPGTTEAVVTVAALEEYKDAFRDLTVHYPESWHLLVTAEDRCRAEHFVRLKRDLDEKHRKGLAPDYEPSQPWNGVFRVAARDREYWDRHVREPALLFRTAGKHKEQPGGTGSLTDLTQEKPKPRGTRKSQKERLKAQLAKDRGNRPREVPETRPAKRRAEGPRETTEAGTSPTSRANPSVSGLTTGNAKEIALSKWHTHARSVWGHTRPRDVARGPPPDQPANPGLRSPVPGPVHSLTRDRKKKGAAQEDGTDHVPKQRAHRLRTRTRPNRRIGGSGGTKTS